MLVWAVFIAKKDLSYVFLAWRKLIEAKKHTPLGVDMIHNTLEEEIRCQDRTGHIEREQYISTPLQLTSPSKLQFSQFYYHCYYYYFRTILKDNNGQLPPRR